MKRHVRPRAGDEQRFFVKELRGETAPRFSTLKTLFQLASELFALRPWDLLDETELVLVPQPRTGEICYCSVMGTLGEVLSLRAYIGQESYRLFRKLDAGKQIGAGEFFASQHSVYLEFVKGAELEKQDRELLAALGHRLRPGRRSPIFRTVRPGFHPWFVTEEEAETLALCIRSVVEVCSRLAREERNYWARPGVYPLIRELAGEQPPRYEIRMLAVSLPSEPPLAPAQLGESELHELRSRDHAVRGVIELDYFLSAVVIGNPNERKACAALALAVDGESGLVFPPQLSATTIPPGDVMALAFTKAVAASRCLPRELRVRSRRLGDCLAPISEVCGVPIRVVRSLPALERAQRHLLDHLGVA